MPDNTDEPRLPSPEEVEVLGCVPLLAAFFRRDTVAMSDELRTVFDAHGLSARHGAVLGQLTVAESMSVSDIARVLGVSLSTASELVGDLSRAGVVERNEDPDNRRRTLVKVADQHRSSVEQLVAGRAAPLLRVMDGLTPRDRQGFAAGIRAWADEVRHW